MKGATKPKQRAPKNAKRGHGSQGRPIEEGQSEKTVSSKHTTAAEALLYRANDIRQKKRKRRKQRLPVEFVGRRPKVLLIFVECERLESSGERSICATNGDRTHGHRRAQTDQD